MAEDFLATMAASSRRRVEAAKVQLSQSELTASLVDLPAPPALQLSERGFDVIAEMKLRSPALGQLANTNDDSADARIRAYVQGGAAAISVLTEPDRFDGSLDHLRAASALRVVRQSTDGRARRIPTMRKDFWSILIKFWRRGRRALAGVVDRTDARRSQLELAL